MPPSSASAARLWKISKLSSRIAYERMNEALKELCFDSGCMNQALMHVIMTPPGTPNIWLNKQN